MASLTHAIRSIALLFAAATLATGCASSGTSENVAVAAPPAYLLGAGDRLKIVVIGEQSINGEYSVGTDGTVPLALIGNVEARGMSVKDLQDAIAKELSPRYLLDPHVSVEVINFRPFYILGEVSRPGSYPFVDSISVMQAVSIAGGYTYRANLGKVFIRHADSQVEESFPLKSSRQVWVKPGDTIRVGERLF